MTDDHLLPIELQCALDDALVGVSIGDLRLAATRLSDAYRRSQFGGSSVSLRLDALTGLAYAATRMPATFAATRAVLRQLRDRYAELRVETLLDLGSGPATTLWAAGYEFPELAYASLVEREPAMLALARRLLKDSSLAAKVKAVWYPQTEDVHQSHASHDLVVVSYVLTELDGDARAALLRLAWQACRSAIVVILPGSTMGFRFMLDARAQLLSLGGTVVAPCPHTDPCPLPDGDWCHFGVRLNRSSLHRRLKGGVLAHEDEKYSYVVATRGLGTPVTARVIRRPGKGDRRTTLQLCTVDGLRDKTIARSDREAYRRARKVQWGDSWG